MRERQYRYLQKTTSNGRTYLYFRCPGHTRVTLPGPLGSARFREAYEAALGQVRWPVTPSDRLATIKVKRPPDPPQIGVYLLIFKGKVAYIGSSLDMPARVAGHRANGRPFDRAFYIPTHPGERLGLEAILIKALQPRQNKNRAPEGAVATAIA